MTEAARSIVTLGEILVEIMAEDPGNGFRLPVRLIGPFPSGAPAIFIDQVGRLGYPCGIIAAIGNDDFGKVNIDRLRADGVDVSAIDVAADYPTGTAFVRYRDDGERDFVFNIRHSASGQLALTPAAYRLIDSCGHFHVMGSSLFSAGIIGVAKEACDRARAAGATISFDPNLRDGMLQSRETRMALDWMLRHCDIFLPSGTELMRLTDAADEVGAIAAILGLGVGAIVVKRGADGASYHDASETLFVPAFPAMEIDPTGAGDCFDATFITCRMLGRSVGDSLRYAAASGAHAVSVRGPMEGAASFEALDTLMARSGVGR